jgi:hypothetical protein
MFQLLCLRDERLGRVLTALYTRMWWLERKGARCREPPRIASTLRAARNTTSRPAGPATCRVASIPPSLRPSCPSTSSSASPHTRPNLCAVFNSQRMSTAKLAANRGKFSSSCAARRCTSWTRAASCAGSGTSGCRRYRKRCARMRRYTATPSASPFSLSLFLPIPLPKNRLCIPPLKTWR